MDIIDIRAGVAKPGLRYTLNNFENKTLIQLHFRRVPTKVALKALKAKQIFSV